MQPASPTFSIVTPAQAGAHLEISGWIPACAGMTSSVWAVLGKGETK